MSNDIYSYIKENFGIEITDYQFKRDYIKNPIHIAKNGRGSERPYKEDLEYLYITLHLSINSLNELFKTFAVARWINKFNIKKSQKQMFKDRHLTFEKNFMKKYNVKNPFQITEIIEKSQESKFKKYGNKNNYEKIKQTCLEKYGVDNLLELSEIREKIKQTCLEKYGVEKIGLSQECIEKRKNTINHKIKENPFYRKEINNKISKSKKEKLKSNPNYYKEINNKILKTIEQKLKDDPDYYNKIKLKRYNTEKERNIFNGGTSKIENEIFNLLKLKYSKTIHFYSSEKYPFECDFYIPELDLYIEYQGFWSHGK